MDDYDFGFMFQSTLPMKGETFARIYLRKAKKERRRKRYYRMMARLKQF